MAEELKEGTRCLFVQAHVHVVELDGFSEADWGKALKTQLNYLAGVWVRNIEVIDLKKLVDFLEGQEAEVHIVEAVSAGQSFEDFVSSLIDADERVR